MRINNISYLIDAFMTTYGQLWISIKFLCLISVRIMVFSVSSEQLWTFQPNYASIGRIKTINYSILILITLLGVVVPAWYYGQNTLITPLILGVIAAALAESDDSFTGRLKALTLTFICFAIAAFSIELLFDTPWLFALGLFASTFSFIMLGAIGPKYASIAFGSSAGCYLHHARRS